MKLVDFVSKSPKQLDLHFYDFCTNFYEFWKLTDLNLGVPGTFTL